MKEKEKIANFVEGLDDKKIILENPDGTKKEFHPQVIYWLEENKYKQGQQDALIKIYNEVRKIVCSEIEFKVLEIQRVINNLLKAAKE